MNLPFTYSTKVRISNYLKFLYYAILSLFLNAVDFGATFFLVQKMAGCHLIFIAPSMHTNGPAVSVSKRR